MNTYDYSGILVFKSSLISAAVWKWRENFCIICTFIKDELWQFYRSRSIVDGGRALVLLVARHRHFHRLLSKGTKDKSKRSLNYLYSFNHLTAQSARWSAVSFFASFWYIYQKVGRDKKENNGYRIDEKEAKNKDNLFRELREERIRKWNRTTRRHPSDITVWFLKSRMKNIKIGIR